MKTLLGLLMAAILFCLFGCSKTIEAKPLTDEEKAWLPYQNDDTLVFISDSKLDTIRYKTYNRSEFQLGTNLTRNIFGVQEYVDISYLTINIVFLSGKSSFFIPNIIEEFSVANRGVYTDSVSEDKYYVDELLVRYDGAPYIYNNKLATLQSEIPWVFYYTPDTNVYNADTIWVQHGKGIIKVSPTFSNENYKLL